MTAEVLCDEVVEAFFFLLYVTAVPRESFTGLKPSTLKQLGQAVTTTAKQVNTQTQHTQTSNEDADFIRCPHCVCVYIFFIGFPDHSRRKSACCFTDR